MGALLTDQPGASGRGIEEALNQAGVQQKTGREAVRRAIDAGYIRTQPGQRGARLHYLTPSGERFAEVPQSASKRVSAGDALATKITSDQHVINMSDALKTPGHGPSASARRSSSGFTQRGESECVSASIGDAHTLTDADDECVIDDSWVLAHLTAV